MKIYDFFPSPKDIINNELNTLVFLKNDPKICETYSSLSNSASTYYDKYYRPNPQYFRFESQIPINYESKRSGIAFLGVVINASDKSTFEQLSYSLAIIDDFENKIIRKYHFDYDLPKPQDIQPHPVFHIQYGGKLSETLENITKSRRIDISNLDVWMSVPRIYNMPMSLALLINIVLQEFPNEFNMKLIQKNEFRDIIRQNEKLLLKEFFRSCHLFINNSSDNLLFVNDFLYGKN